MTEPIVVYSHNRTSHNNKNKKLGIQWTTEIKPEEKRTEGTIIYILFYYTYQN